MSSSSGSLVVTPSSCGVHLAPATRAQIHSTASFFAGTIGSTVRDEPPSLEVRADEPLLAVRPAIGKLHGGGFMDFSTQLDELQQRISEARSAAEAAEREPADQRRQRIDEAQADTDRAVTDTQQQAPEAAAGKQSKWAQMKADAAAKRDDARAKLDKRTRQMDASAAAGEADWAETDAAEAVSFAIWTVDNARLSVLDAIDARVYADELAKAASS
jgi:hypothetical protein